MIKLKFKYIRIKKGRTITLKAIKDESQVIKRNA